MRITDPVPVLSAALLAIFLVTDSVTEKGDMVRSLSENLLYAGGLLIMAPRCRVIRERRNLSIYVLSAVFIVAKMSGILGFHPFLFVIVLSEILFLRHFYGERLSRIMILFKELSPKKYFEDMTLAILHALYLLLFVLTYVSGLWGDLYGEVSALTVGVVAYSSLIYMRIRNVEPMFRSSRIARMYEKYGSSGKIAPSDKAIAKACNLKSIFERAEEYMDSKKPYLVEGFSMEDLSERIYVNKNYLSRAINTYSGKRFRLWLNTYRVMYSIELFKQDKKSKISTLAMLSGFKTVVSYNQAFKIVMEETPSEYFKRLRQELD